MDIEKIRQEIERRINILTNVYEEQMERKDEEMMNYYHGKVIALEELRCSLDTLSEEPDKEDLNDEIKKYIEEYGYERGEDRLLIAIVARHFAEWGAEHLRDSTKKIDKSLEE